MKRLYVLVVIGLLVMSMGFSKGQSESPVPSEQVTEMGSLQYNEANMVNDGEPITVELWYWTGGANLFKSFADQYSEVHPNVTIKLVENPWNDYWTKLPLALQGKNGPAIFNFHNSQQDNLIGYMAPYTIPVEELEEEFVGVKGHLIDDKIYYTDYGLMTATMYYNTDMWEAANLTDDDIPKTWDQFREVAKQLTIRKDGQLVQAGYSYNGGIQGDVLGMQYQYGQNLFTENDTISLNNDAMKNVIGRLSDLYDSDQVGDLNFGNNSGDNFGQGKVAMFLGWGFMTNVLQSNFPETDFKCFEIPVPSEDVPYAYHRYNGESTFGVNKNASKAQQAVAQDMIAYFLSNDAIQKEFCMENAVFPAKNSLRADADLLAIPSVAVLADHIDRYIWPGTMPSTVENNVKIMLENIFYNNMNIEDALSNAETQINSDLEDVSFSSQEPMYKYYSERL